MRHNYVCLHYHNYIGQLAAVTDVRITVIDSFTHLTWGAPFSLNITKINPDIPDITYRVDVVNSTNSVTLFSQDGINVTEFSYPIPPRSWCHLYLFTVTPVNTVGDGIPFTHGLVNDTLTSMPCV